MGALKQGESFVCLEPRLKSTGQWLLRVNYTLDDRHWVRPPLGTNLHVVTAGLFWISG